jgi:DNA-binding transcriptional LysR family regulator
LTQTTPDDWNDLRLVLAIARARGLVGAAQALGIDHSTAFRRLHTIERRLGQQLFERSPGGAYQPTSVGQRMAAAAERMEDEAFALARDIAGRDHRLTGHLRVTSSETLAHRILTPLLASYRSVHPGIVVELIIDNRVLSLTRREADVALRPMRPTEGDLWGRKLADVAWAVYGAGARLKTGSLKGVSDLKHHPLIGWDAGAVGINAAEWLATAVPEGAIVYRTSSLINQLAAAKAAIGLALLPCYLGDSESGLERALPRPIPELARELWIVTHADLRQTARVRAFFDLVGNGLAAEQALFEGRQPKRCRDPVRERPQRAPRRA